MPFLPFALYPFLFFANFQDEPVRRDVLLVTMQEALLKRPAQNPCKALPENSSAIGSVRELATEPPEILQNSRSAASLCVSGRIVALAFAKARATFQYFSK